MKIKALVVAGALAITAALGAQTQTQKQPEHYTDQEALTARQLKEAFSVPQTMYVASLLRDQLAAFTAEVETAHKGYTVSVPGFELVTK